MTQQLSSKSQLSQNIQAGGDIKHRKKWQAIETQKYCQFIQRNRSTLQETQKKQKQRIYNKMAQYIGTRTTHQCRSHHQKIMKRYATIDAFIQTFSKRYDPIMTYGRYPISDTMGGMQWSKSGEQQINKVNFNLNQAHNQLKHFTQPKFRTFQVQTNQINSENQKKKNYQNNFHPLNKIQNNDFLPFHKTFSSTFKIIQNPSTTRRSSNQYDISKKSFQPSNNNQNNSTCHPTIVKTIILNNNQNNQNLMNQKQMRNYNNQNSGQYNNFPKNSKLQKNPDQKKSYVNNFLIQSNYNFFNPSNNSQGQFSTTLKQTKRKRKNKNPLIPSYEVLTKNSEALLSNASQICSSILYKKNLNVINPLVKQNRIELTNTTIKIKGKQQDDYKIWVQCMKQQQKSESSSKVNSDSQQIQRQLVKQILIDILQKQGLLGKNINEHYLDKQPYIDKMMPLDRNILPYYYDNKQFNIESTQKIDQLSNRQTKMEYRQKINQLQQIQNIQQQYPFPYQQYKPSSQQQMDKNRFQQIQKQVQAKRRNYYDFLQMIKDKNGQKKPKIQNFQLSKQSYIRNKLYNNYKLNSFNNCQKQPFQNKYMAPTGTGDNDQQDKNGQKREKFDNSAKIKPHQQPYFVNRLQNNYKLNSFNNCQKQPYKDKYMAPTGTGDNDQQDNDQKPMNKEENNLNLGFNNFDKNMSQKNKYLKHNFESLIKDKKQNIKQQIKQIDLQYISGSQNKKQKQ